MRRRKEKEEAIIINSDFQSQIQFSDNQNIINFLINIARQIIIIGREKCVESTTRTLALRFAQDNCIELCI